MEDDGERSYKEILQHRKVDGQHQYLVRWRDTWVDAEDISGLEDATRHLNISKAHSDSEDPQHQSAKNSRLR